MFIMDNYVNPRRDVAEQFSSTQLADRTAQLWNAILHLDIKLR